jgi:hypothetical protein
VRRHGSLAELFRMARDPAYLEFKQKLGEPLSPGELATLEAARAGAAKPEGGAT